MPSARKSETLDAIWEHLVAAMDLAGITGQPQEVTFTHTIDGELKTMTVRVQEVVRN